MPSSGMPRANASALATLSPTSSAPARPGPWVTAIASMSSQSTLRLGERRSSTGTIARRCARAATSGTTRRSAACTVLRRQALASTAAAVAHDRGGRLVAARLDTQDPHHARSISTPPPTAFLPINTKGPLDIGQPQEAPPSPVLRDWILERPATIR